MTPASAPRTTEMTNAVLAIVISAGMNQNPAQAIALTSAIGHQLRRGIGRDVGSVIGCSCRSSSQPVVLRLMPNERRVSARIKTSFTVWMADDSCWTNGENYDVPIFV